MKTTLATIKSFIRKNEGNLWINVKSSFDGMTDGCEYRDGGFKRALRDADEWNQKHTLGVGGAWFVGSSRDYFTEYNANGMRGYEVSNCCGHFVIAIEDNNNKVITVGSLPEGTVISYTDMANPGNEAMILNKYSDAYGSWVNIRWIENNWEESMRADTEIGDRWQIVENVTI